MEVAPTERPGHKLIKKLFAVAAATGLLLSLAGLTPAYNEDKDVNAEKPGQKIERSMPVAPEALIRLCVASGTLTIHSWDKQEIRVRSADAEQIEFRRVDKPKDPNAPATYVAVMVWDKASRANPRRDCQAIADVEMDVPAGAAVQAQTHDGDIRIAGIAKAYAGSQNGDITIERVTRLVEAGTLGGSILLKDSSGRGSLKSAGGIVEAVNLRGVDASDALEVFTVSGDVQLDRVSIRKVAVNSVSGAVTMSGALAKQGYYNFSNMTGDLLLELPADASFRLSAKVSDKQDIITDFVLKYIGEPAPPEPPTPKPRVAPAAPPEEPAASSGAAPKKGPAAKDPKTPAPPKDKEKPAAKGGTVGPGPLVTIGKPTVVAGPNFRRVEAICGSGDAMISVASFGGTVRLKKL